MQQKVFWGGIVTKKGKEVSGEENLCGSVGTADMQMWSCCDSL